MKNPSYDEVVEFPTGPVVEKDLLQHARHGTDSNICFTQHVS